MSGILSVLAATPVTPSTWDASGVSGANFVFTNGIRVNSDVTQSSASQQAAIGTLSRKFGKRYFEVLVVTGDGTAGRFFVGTAESTFTKTNFLGGAAFSAGDQDASGWSAGTDFAIANNAVISYNTAGVVIGVALDLDAGKGWISKANTWAVGSPSGGTTPSITFTANLVLFPACSIFGGGGAKLRLRAAAQDQSFVPPTGFTPWDN